MFTYSFTLWYYLCNQSQKGKKMGYIKKIKTDKDKRKVISVRVPEIVVNAFNSAGIEAEELGFEFKMPDVIEEALINTLDELKDETGVDFLKLEKFKYEMNSLQEKLKIDSNKEFDFNKESNEIKSQAQAFKIGNPDETVDIDLMIKEKEQEIKAFWNEHLINKKEKKVETELEKILEENMNLQRQNELLLGLQDRDYYEGGGHAAEMASNDGWGKINFLSHIVGNESRDSFLDEHDELIEAITKLSSRVEDSEPLSGHLLEQWENIKEMYDKAKTKNS